MPARLSWKALHHYFRQEVQGHVELEVLLPSTYGALRKAAGRGTAPWWLLRETRSIAGARQVLDALRRQ